MLLPCYYYTQVLDEIRQEDERERIEREDAHILRLIRERVGPHDNIHSIAERMRRDFIVREVGTSEQRYAFLNTIGERPVVRRLYRDAHNFVRLPNHLQDAHPSREEYYDLFIGFHSPD